MAILTIESIIYTMDTFYIIGLLMLANTVFAYDYYYDTPSSSSVSGGTVAPWH